MKIKNVLILVLVCCCLAMGFTGCTTVDSLDPMAPQNKNFACRNLTSDKVLL